LHVHTKAAYLHKRCIFTCFQATRGYARDTCTYSLLLCAAYSYNAHAAYSHVSREHAHMCTYSFLHSGAYSNTCICSIFTCLRAARAYPRHMHIHFCILTHIFNAGAHT